MSLPEYYTTSQLPQPQSTDTTIHLAFRRLSDRFRGKMGLCSS
jgi:hypothetical protein